MASIPEPTANGADLPRDSSPYLMLAFLCVAAVIAYAQRQVVAVTKEAMQAELELTKNQVGWILSAFFAGYSVFQVPLGWAGDTFGARRTLVFCVTLSALATSLVPIAPTAAALIAVWAICGTAQAGLFPVAARLIVGAFPVTRRAMASGLLGSSMSLGAAVMAALAGELLGRGIRWQWIVLMAAVPGFLWSAAFLAWRQNAPTVSPSSTGALATQGKLRKLFAMPALWFVCLQQFLRAAGYIFFVSWFSTYLKETSSVSIDQAGWLNSLPLVAVVVGSPLGGIVSDLLLSRTGSRRLSQQGLAITSLLMCATCIVAVFWIKNPLAATGLISVGSFFAGACGPIGYAVTMHLGGQRVATVFGIMNMCGNIGAGLFPLVAAQLRTATGNWNLVLGLFAGIYLAAAGCWMLIDPNQTLAAGDSR